MDHKKHHEDDGPERDQNAHGNAEPVDTREMLQFHRAAPSGVLGGDNDFQSMRIRRMSECLVGIQYALQGKAMRDQLRRIYFF